jgi:hypothetical protein
LKEVLWLTYNEYKKKREEKQNYKKETRQHRGDKTTPSQNTEKQWKRTQKKETVSILIFCSSKKLLCFLKIMQLLEFDLWASCMLGGILPLESLHQPFFNFLKNRFHYILNICMLYMYTAYFEQVHPFHYIPISPFSLPHFFKLFGDFHYAAFEDTNIVYFNPLHSALTLFPLPPPIDPPPDHSLLHLCTIFSIIITLITTIIII